MFGWFKKQREAWAQYRRQAIAEATICDCKRLGIPPEQAINILNMKNRITPQEALDLLAKHERKPSL